MDSKTTGAAPLAAALLLALSACGAPQVPAGGSPLPTGPAPTLLPYATLAALTAPQAPAPDVAAGLAADAAALQQRVAAQRAAQP